MIDIAILGISILLRLTAAYLSLRKTRKTANRYPWTVLAVALVLMALTQIVTLSEALLDEGGAVNTPVEMVALVISVLMITCVLGIEPVLKAVTGNGQKTRVAKAREASYLDAAPGIVLALDKTGTVILINRGGCVLLGYDKNEILGRNWFSDFLPEQEAARVSECFRKFVADGQEFSEPCETEVLTKQGKRIPVRWASTLVRDGGDAITGVLSTGTDISSQRELEEQLAESEERFCHVVESAAIGIIVILDDGMVNQMNPFMEKMFGYQASEVIGENVSILMPEPDRGRHDKYIQSYLLTGEKKIIGSGREIIGLRKNGEEFPLHLNVSEVSGSGQKKFVGIVTDITERKLVEGRLRHSQKMETVGQLTGGVAHDFNNLLAVILGNLSLLEEELKENGGMKAAEIQEFIQPALAAGGRGAELTQRLLAFSRKQALQPVTLDINAVIKDMKDLLERTLGEDVDIEWRLDANTWLAEADKSQLDNVLLNLAVNARDAMLQGGSLTIETAEVTLDSQYAGSHGEAVPGEYLMLAVSDTGTGMPASVLERIFEPFFTTKEVGKGTGLGLSMVYGFARQSGGHVAIYSELGEGTTVKLYLPRAEATSVTETVVLEKDQTSRPLAGNETILLVEDEAAVLCITSRILERLGYMVFQAKDGQEALGILAKEGPVDLLLTDVVLPGGMSGPDIAKLAQQKVPGLKILYMSGYTENAILHHGRMDEGTSLIGKPFSNADLGARVRQVLDSTE